MTRTYLFLFLVIFIIFISCSKESTVGPKLPKAFLEGQYLICTPLAPAPGDTAVLTFEVSGYSSNGLPVVNWSVNIGSLLATEGFSVDWVIPDTTGLFEVSAIATVDGVSDTMSRYIMVRNFEELNTGIKLSMFPHIGTSFYFIGSKQSPDTANFGGYNAYRYSNSNSVKLTGSDEEPVLDGGFDLSYHNNNVLGSFICVEDYSSFNNASQNVVYYSLFGLGGSFITNDFDGGGYSRKNTYIHPYGDEDLEMVVWQEHIVGEERDGTKDLVNIGFWKRPSTKMTLTRNMHLVPISAGDTVFWKPRYFNNIKPILTPDDNYIIYFVDSTEVFEPCIIPIVGGIPDTTQRRAFMVSEDHGLFGVNGISVDESTVFQWNPTRPTILGFIDSGGKLCFFDYYTEDVTVVPGINGASEMAWSPDGNRCAVVATEGIAVANLAGDASFVFAKEKDSDELVSVNWSPEVEEPTIGFRMIRKGKSGVDSYSALVLYSLNDNIWYYATPAVRWSAEPPVDYRWMRVLFNNSKDDIYLPMPVVEPETNMQVSIFHSFM